jgi:hypothetical protein
MYAFAQHPNVTAIDEPFYAYYLRSKDVTHPGQHIVMQSQPHDYNLVFDQIDSAAAAHPVVFIKNMGHHIHGIQANRWSAYQNFFLIRDPRRLVTSLSKILKNPILRDTGMDIQLRLMNHFIENDRPFFVVDSGKILDNPSKYLPIMCDRLGLPFSEEMLTWPAGPKTCDGAWASFWYKNVHQTTGFSPQKSSSDPLPNHCVDLYKKCEDIYAQMVKHAL